jgi:hypothetical protein
MTIYEFIHCDCIHESSFRTVSIHRTKIGAYRAMRKYLLQEYLIWYNGIIRHGKGTSFYWIDKFGTHEDWGIREIYLLD